jgi:hypothetical protein
VPATKFVEGRRTQSEKRRELEVIPEGEKDRQTNQKKSGQTGSTQSEMSVDSESRDSIHGMI